MLVHAENPVHTHLYVSAGLRAWVYGGDDVVLSTAAGSAPRVDRLVVLERTDVAPRRPALSPGSRLASVQVHRLGGPLVDRRLATISAGVGSLGLLEAGYGPGTAAPFLPRELFRGVGTPIDRDDPQVREMYREDPPRWIIPGSPSVARFRDWRVGRGTVRAAACRSADTAGGFVLLTPTDVARVFGFDPDLELGEEDLRDLLPLEPLLRMSAWLSGS